LEFERLVCCFGHVWRVGVLNSVGVGVF